MDTDGKTSVLDDGIHLANGIGFSPDAKQVYLTDSAARIIYRYDYDVRTGDVRNRSVLVRVPLDEGVPDGLAVDAEGFLWSAQWYGGCVVRYDADGKVERKVPIPAKQTSSLAFGGPDLAEMFITSAAQHFPSPLMPPNYDPESGFMGGRCTGCAPEFKESPNSKQASNQPVEHYVHNSLIFLSLIADINIYNEVKRDNMRNQRI